MPDLCGDHRNHSRASPPLNLTMIQSLITLKGREAFSQRRELGGTSIVSLPAGNYSPAEISFRDAGNEISTQRFFGKLITAANHDAQGALFATYVGAAAALALGSITKEVYAHETLQIGAIPTNGAMREVKLLVQYSDDTTGEKFTTTLPTLDPTLPEYVSGAKDVIKLDSPSEITDFITAFEAFAVNPVSPTHAITVYGLKVVGRNI